MQIFINKNGQQTGPFEESKVLEMLNSGQLSPNDFGFREGQTQWVTLGNLFPDISANVISAAPQVVPLAANKVKNSGGCRKIFGTILLVFGLLFFVGGIGLAITNYIMTKSYPPFSCQKADEYQKKSEQSLKEYQDAKGTPLETEKGKKAKEDIDGFGIYGKGCGEMLDYYRWWLIVFAAIGIFGLFGAVIGFFVRRV